MIRVLLIVLALAGCAPQTRKMDWQSVVEDLEHAPR